MKHTKNPRYQASKISMALHFFETSRSGTCIIRLWLDFKISICKYTDSFSFSFVLCLIIMSTPVLV